MRGVARCEEEREALLNGGAGEESGREELLRWFEAEKVWRSWVGGVASWKNESLAARLG